MQKLGIASLPFLAALTFAFDLFGIGTGLTFQSATLRLVLDVSFILVIAMVVARISAKSFLLTGSVNILLLGTAVLEFGVFSALGGAVSGLNFNSGVAVYVIGALTAGSLHLVSAILTFRGSPRRAQRRMLRILACYGGAIAFAATIAALATASLLPSTLGEQGSIEQSVLLSVLALFLTSAFFFSRVYSRSHNPVLYWYGLALATSSLAFLAFLKVQVSGDLPEWIGRGVLYTGSIYFLISVWRAPRALTAIKPLS